MTDHAAAPLHLERHDSALGRWLIARWRPAHLAGIVDHLWYFEGTVLHPRERIFPDGRIEFNVHLGPRYGEVRGGRVERFAETCISGLLLRPSVIEAPAGPSAVLGVRMLPTGAYALLGAPLHELTGTTVDLAELVGCAAAELAERCAAAEEPARGGAGTRIHLHVDDVDALARRAAAAGATIVMEPTDQAHGERQCRLHDPSGHEWLLGHPVEEVPLDEVRRRIEAEG